MIAAERQRRRLITGFNPVHLSWGIGSLGTITMISAVSNLYLFFLVSVAQMSPIVAGSLISASKFVDMATDPLMGWISDRTNTRWGRRRPYMFVASFACAATLIGLFSVPLSSDPGALERYVFAFLILYAIALTAFNVPYLAMPAEMTDDYDERSGIMSYRAMFLVGGGFLGSALAGKLIVQFGGGLPAYRILGYVLAGVVFIAMMITVLGTRNVRYTAFVKPTISALSQAKLFFLNKPFLVLASAKAFQFLQLAAGGASTLFFFVSVMNRDESLLLPFGTAVITGSLLSLRIWLPVIRKFGKRETLMAALGVQGLIHLSWLLAGPGEAMWVFIARAFFLGTMSGAVLICSQSMIVDTIEYDRKLSGINREGLYSSVFSFIEKSMHATGPLIVGIVLTQLGYDPSIPRGQAQPETALTAIYFGQAWLPALCSFFMIAILLFYRLTQEQLANVKRHAIGQAPTSVTDQDVTEQPV